MKHLLFLLLVCSNAFASVGTITEQVNAVPSIQRNKNTIAGSKGTGVEMNDIVNTARGKAGITFADNTKVEVNENSKLTIDDFVYDPKNSQGGKLAVKVALGTVRYASGQIAKNNPQSVAVNTPAATIGVRGTDFTATVDELGESTVILLPSCPQGYVDVERDCKTGVITVSNEAGSVTLNRPFEGTKVANRNSMPMRPAILNLTADSISNLLILSPPNELKKDKELDKGDKILHAGNMLEVNFLKQDFLKNELDNINIWGVDPLSEKLLDQSFLMNIFMQLSLQLQAETTAFLANLLNLDPIIPDYVPGLGVVAIKETSTVKFTRDNGADAESVVVSKFENSTVYLIQNGNTIKNRVNTGNGTVIRLIQK
jgi:FecR protein